MDQSRKAALAVGVLFIITFAASIPALILYGPVLNDPDYVLGAGADGQIALGALLEFITGVANIGTAVVLFPILRRQSESIALGYVASRTLESTVIVVGAVSLLAVVALRQDLAGAVGAEAAMLVVAAKSLVAVHDATFLLGPAFCAAFGNGLLLGYLMYRSRLVPRPMALIGLVGGSIAFGSALLVLFGFYEQVSHWSFIGTLGEIVWEGSLGLWLTFKGFSPSSLAVKDGAAAPTVAAPAALRLRTA
jgi:hypothetical protein